MGMLSRFADIMKANMNALLDRSDNPEKTINEFLRNLNSDLGQVRAETESALTAESRAKRALDESSAEIRKLQRYAEKSVEAGNDEDALKFLERKAKQMEKHHELQAAYERSAATAAKLKEIQDKLVSDIGRLEARGAELKGKMASMSVQQSLNSGSFDAAEERVNRSFDEAMALAEIREGNNNDLDAVFEQMERRSVASAEEELAAIKDKLKKKD